jgi:hypothetical protein
MPSILKCPLCKTEVVVKELPSHLDSCRSEYVDQHASRLGFNDPRIAALFRPQTHDAANQARYISVESPVSPLFLEAAKRDDLKLDTRSIEVENERTKKDETFSTSQHAIVMLPDGPHYILAEHDAHEILPGSLYLSSEAPARSLVFLRNNNIKAVVNCAIDSHPLPFEELQSAGVEIFTHVKIVDSPGVSNRKGIEDALDAVIDAVNKVEGRGAVLVHCIAGVSRSATTVIAYLMKQHKKSLLEAAYHVKKIRRVIYPNIGFFRVLRELELEFNNDGKHFEPSLPETALELHKASQNEHFMTAIRVQEHESKGF